MEKLNHTFEEHKQGELAKYKEEIMSPAGAASMLKQRNIDTITISDMYRILLGFLKMENLRW